MAECRQAVLSCWVAVNNDSNKRERSTGDSRRTNGKPIPQSQPDPSYKGVIGAVVFFHRPADADSRESEALARTVTAIQQRYPEMGVSDMSMYGNTRSDHQGILASYERNCPRRASGSVGHNWYPPQSWHSLDAYRLGVDG